MSNLRKTKKRIILQDTVYNSVLVNELALEQNLEKCFQHIGQDLQLSELQDRLGFYNGKQKKNINFDVIFLVRLTKILYTNIEGWIYLDKVVEKEFLDSSQENTKDESEKRIKIVISDIFFDSLRDTFYSSTFRIFVLYNVYICAELPLSFLSFLLSLLFLYNNLLFIRKFYKLWKNKKKSELLDFLVATLWRQVMYNTLIVILESRLFKRILDKFDNSNVIEMYSINTIIDRSAKSLNRKHQTFSLIFFGLCGVAFTVVIKREIIPHIISLLIWKKPPNSEANNENQENQAEKEAHSSTVELNGNYCLNRSIKKNGRVLTLEESQGCERYRGQLIERRMGLHTANGALPRIQDDMKRRALLLERRERALLEKLRGIGIYGIDKTVFKHLKNKEDPSTPFFPFPNLFKECQVCARRRRTSDLNQLNRDIEMREIAQVVETGAQTDAVVVITAEEQTTRNAIDLFRGEILAEHEAMNRFVRDNFTRDPNNPQHLIPRFVPDATQTEGGTLDLVGQTGQARAPMPRARHYWEVHFLRQIQEQVRQVQEFVAEMLRHGISFGRIGN